MKTLVVYDSQFGNTRELALAIADELEVVGSVQVESVRDQSPPVLPGDLGLLVVGGPTRVHGISPLLRKWLAAIQAHSLDGVDAAAFDTRSPGPRWLTGAASKGIARALTRKGAKLVVAPESFLVQHSEGPLADGELERARDWAPDILAHRNARPVAFRATTR